MSKNEVTVIDAEEPERGNERALVLAKQVGYEGGLTAEVLEDEIRFYQRRTVESLLELGKRLLVFKALIPHGEFARRVEAFGYSERTAQRFMQAAIKTAKSANLALLSTQMKNSGAFLELVTHDDDVLEELAEMDDIDRLSASQLRQRVRELEDNGTKAEASLSAELTKTESLLETSRLELERVVRGEGLQLLSRHIRAEAVANASVVQAACDDLLRLWRAALNETVASEVDADMRRRAVAMAVSGAMAHMAAVMATVREESGEPMPMMPGAMDELTEDERAAAQASAARLQEQLQDVRQRRRSDAYEEHLLAGGAPKRGRPEGSKTKADKTAKGGKK